VLALHKQVLREQELLIGGQQLRQVTSQQYQEKVILLTPQVVLSR